MADPDSGGQGHEVLEPSGARGGDGASSAGLGRGSERGGLLLIDVRGFSPGLVRPFMTAVVDELVLLDARDELVIVSAYECSGLAYQLDLRRETRGLFHYECTQRADGAWVETIRRV